MVLVCKECKEYPAKIVEDNCSGDTICGSCGLVLGDHMIDTRPEWLTFAGEDDTRVDPNRCGDTTSTHPEWLTFAGDDDTGVDPNRCGGTASTLLQGNQLETTIAFDDSTAERGISRAQKKTHEKTHDNATNKILLKGYSDIDAYCQSMALTGTSSETIKQYFKKAYESKAVKGKDRIAIIASCIFLACRCCGVARNFYEVMAVTECSGRGLSWAFAVLSKLFRNGGASVARRDNTNTARGGTIHSMIPRICSHL